MKHQKTSAVAEVFSLSITSATGRTVATATSSLLLAVYCYKHGN